MMKLNISLKNSKIFHHQEAILMQDLSRHSIFIRRVKLTHHLKGYASGQLGYIAFYKKEDGHMEVVFECFTQAAKEYIKAASYFPVDDENHLWYLNYSLDYLYAICTPIREILPIMERIRLGIPEKKKIWEFSALSSTLDKGLEKTLKVEENIREGLRSGKLILNDQVSLERWLNPK
ncbi:hypothetical protein C8Q75DRAFT_557071 [Abortiporus biennis]|nr:hypothetical protein C8Q75DRAFT_557071 [Abortiporus biennis]